MSIYIYRKKVNIQILKIHPSKDLPLPFYSLYDNNNNLVCLNVWVLLDIGGMVSYQLSGHFMFLCLKPVKNLMKNDRKSIKQYNM